MRWTNLTPAYATTAPSAALLLAIVVGDPGRTCDLLEHLLTAPENGEIAETLASAAQRLRDTVVRLRTAGLRARADVPTQGSERVFGGSSFLQ